MAVSDNLLAAIESYSEALASDALNPQPDYNIDGKQVSRSQWRAGITKQIHDLQQIYNQLNPYVIYTKQVL